MAVRGALPHDRTRCGDIGTRVASVSSRVAIGDWLTLVGLTSLAVLLRWKISNPLLIAVTAMLGLFTFPLLQPSLVGVKGEVQ